MPTTSSLRVSLAVLCIAAAACGTTIVDNQSSGTTGSGGTGTSTGTGGAGTTTNTDTSTGDAGAPQASCGGKVGVACPPDQFCKYPDGAPCGNFDVPGICLPRPTMCDTDCPGACGCDGLAYCNACEANAGGTDVSGDLACMEDATYSAVSMFTNIPRFTLLKMSKARSLCFRLRIAQEQSPGIGISGTGWSVEAAEVTNDPNDCVFPPGPPPQAMGATALSMSGSGKLSVDMASSVCNASIMAGVDFPPGGPAWVPSGEPFLAISLVIQGGCP